MLDAETGSLTDVALLERSAAGDREAFDAIVARHGPAWRVCSPLDKTRPPPALLAG